MNYLFSVGPLVIVYILLATSLALLMGQLGIYSMAHAAIFGVGAYADAVAVVQYNWSFLPAALLGIGMAVLVSALMTLPATRVAGDYFIVASLAMLIIVNELIKNADGLTGGAGGLPGVLRPIIGPFDLSSDQAYAGFMAIVAACLVGVLVYVSRSPYGRTLRAIRDDQLAAVSLGKDAARYKLSAACLAGAIAGAAGVLYGHFMLFISPDTFGLNTSFIIVAMVIIGGTYSILGAAIGATFLILLPELLQRLSLQPESSGAIQQIVFGALLVAAMFLRPGGLITPGRRRRNAGTAAATAPTQAEPQEVAR